MRETIVMVILALCFGVSTARAQGRFELTPFGGTRFGGQIDLITPNAQNVDYLKIKSTVAYGLIVSYSIFPKFQAEIMWNRQPTQLQTHDATSGAFSNPSEATLDMIQFSGIYEFGREQVKLKPFIV